jgi:hypothetical protein
MGLSQSRPLCPTTAPPRPNSYRSGGGRTVPRAAGTGTAPKAATSSGRRLDWVAIGGRLGALFLGAVGVSVAASAPYRSPAGMAVSILWWALYCGCLGASLGALLGLWIQGGQRPASPPAGASKPRAPAEASRKPPTAEVRRHESRSGFPA